MGACLQQRLIRHADSLSPSCPDTISFVACACNLPLVEIHKEDKDLEDTQDLIAATPKSRRQKRMTGRRTCMLQLSRRGTFTVIVL